MCLPGALLDMTKPNHHILSTGRLCRYEDSLRIEREGDDHEYLPIERVDTLYAHEQIDLNTACLALLDDHGIALHIFDWSGTYVGSYCPTSGHTSGNTIIAQVERFIDPEDRLDIARKIVGASIHNMRTNVRYYNGRRGDLSASCERLAELRETLDEQSFDDVESLMGHEATARRCYYATFDEILAEPFTFKVRSYNPPKNEVNALISYLNALVYTATTSAIHTTALHPAVSYLHAPGNRRTSLALDVADIFKPLIADRILFRICNRNQLNMNSFTGATSTPRLTDEARKIVLEEYEQTLDRTVDHPQLKRKVSYKTLIQTDVYSLKKHILTGETYHPTERWW